MGVSSFKRNFTLFYHPFLFQEIIRYLDWMKRKLDWNRRIYWTLQTGTETERQWIVRARNATRLANQPPSSSRPQPRRATRQWRRRLTKRQAESYPAMSLRLPKWPWNWARPQHRPPPHQLPPRAGRSCKTAPPSVAFKTSSAAWKPVQKQVINSMSYNALPCQSALFIRTASFCPGPTVWQSNRLRNRFFKCRSPPFVGSTKNGWFNELMSRVFGIRPEYR